MIRNAGVLASAVVLGVGSAIVILVTPERRTDARVVAAPTAHPVMPVVTRSELPPRIPAAFAAQTETIVTEVAAA